MTARDAELDQMQKNAAAAQADAADAKKRPRNDTAGHWPRWRCRHELAERSCSFEATSTSIVSEVQTTQQTTKKLLNPDVIHFKGVDLKPGVSLPAETVNRNAPLAAISTLNFQHSFPGQTTGRLSEFNATGRQSRISLLVDGKLPSATLRGYYEADFLSAGTTSNNNQSDSYTLRQRQAWAQIGLNSGWTLTGGQMWSLATEYSHGLANLSEAIPLTIDPQYNVGFNLGAAVRLPRCEGSLEANYGWRRSRRSADTQSWRPQPSYHRYQQAGNAGGLFNPGANYSFNYAPDLLAKMAYETTGAISKSSYRTFLPCSSLPEWTALPGAPPNPSPSALGLHVEERRRGRRCEWAYIAPFEEPRHRRTWADWQWYWPVQQRAAAGCDCAP